MAIKTIHECDFNGYVNKIVAWGDFVSLEYRYNGELEADGIEYSRDEAIAAARAILKHFNAGMDE